MHRALVGVAVATLSVALAWPAGATPPVKPEDFHCILDGVKAEGKNFYIFNRNKRKLARAVKMSGTGELPKRGYPIGTILQVFPFEAMVKRHRGYNPDGGDWEFVKLSITPDGQTQVVASGRAEVANAVGSCQGCHQRLAAAHDLVCEFVVGTSGLGLTPEQVGRIQAADPRCK